MFFVVKNNVLNVDVFTTHSRAFENYQIKKSSGFIPSWFKNSQKEYQVDGEFIKKPTIKTCAGLINNYKSGFIIPLWTDLGIKCTFNENKLSINWKFADETTTATNHPFQEWESFLNPLDYFHVKINSPWLIKTKEDINWFFTSPYWNINPFEISFPQGVLEFKHQHASNINMFFKIEEKTYFLEQNTPLVQLIPLTEKTVKLHHHLISQEEAEKMYPLKSRFINDYNLKRKNCLFT